MDYHHRGSRGVTVSMDGSLQTLDRTGKIWSPAGHLTAKRLRELSRAVQRANLRTLFPAYFTILEVPDQGGLSIDIPEGADVRSIYIASACDVPEIRDLLPLLASLTRD